MQVRCPQCQTPIDLASDGRLTDIACPSCGNSFSLLGTEETLPYEGVRTIGHFQLVEQVGFGSFGFVWKARDSELDRVVAVKIPRKGQLDPDETEQFLREARAAAQLRHPNIVSVHEVGRERDTVFIVSDFIQGATLADRLTAQRFSVREAAELCAKMAVALHHAHDAGVIHRDLKPGNVILDGSGEPHIMDFGLARREAGEVTMTLEGRVLGTPAYMSPEQAKGSAHTADRRSDVYSLGVVLFELLTGERPFRGNTRMLVHQVINDEPPSPRRLNGAVPRDLETICLKCLEKDPGKRYSTAKQLADDLRRFVSGDDIQARPVTRWERAWRWSRRNPRVAALSMAFLAAVVLGFAGVTWQWARAKLETERSRRLLYVSDMNVARQAWDENDVGRVKELLRRHMPLESQDLRGFEWYYLWRLCAVADRAESRKQPGRARRIAVSQATGRLAVGCGNGVVCLWNLKTMQRESLLRTSGSAIHPSEPSRQHPNLMPGWEWLSVAFSPDGQILAYPTADYTGVILQDLRKGTGRSFGGHADIVAAIAFAPDGRFVATGSNDGVVIQHDIQDNTSCELTRCEERVTALAFSTDGSQLAIGAGDGVRILEVSGRGILRSFGEHKDRVWSVAFSPDGKYLASASADHTVIVRNLAAGEYRVLQGHSDEVRSVAFSADGSLLASGSRDDTAALWDIAAGKRIETFKGHSHNVESVAIHQVGDSIRVITGSSDGFVKCWNTGASRTSVLRGKPGVLQVAILPDSRRVVTVDSEQEQVRVWTSENEEWSLTSLSVGKRVHSIAVSSRHLAVGVNDGIRFWRTTDWGEENWRVHTEAVVSALRFSVDGTSIAAGCADGGVLVCQVDASNQPLRFPGHEQFVTCVAFARGGAVLASASYDGTVKMWESGTGRLVNSIHPSTEAIMSVAFSHDDMTLATGGYDKLVRLWRSWTDSKPNAFATIQGHSDGILSMTFSQDDRTLVTGSGDCTLRVWDVHDREERFVFVDHSSAVACADLSLDETLLISGSRDGEIRLWRAAKPEEVRTAGDWWDR